jgi:mannitol-1-/sugar-/sorbitol-6-phosphatase
VTDFPCTAVLFDCDGVLVDSDACVISAWSRWAVDQGFEPDEVVAVVHGRRSADTVRLLVAPEGVPAALARIDRYELEDARSVTAIPGALILTAAIPAQQWAVVTSGTTRLARARLTAAGLPRPDVLVTADDVKHGKPAPDGYLSAARQRGVAVGETVVLEDAVAGIQAARAAGVRAVIGVGGRGLAEVADVVVPDLRAIAWTPDGLTVTV